MSAPAQPVAQMGESLLRPAVTAKGADWHRCDEHDYLGQTPCGICNLVVTRDGATVADQAQAIRDFKDACRAQPVDDLVERLRAQSGKAFGPWELCLEAAARIEALTAMNAEQVTMIECLRKEAKEDEYALAAAQAAQAVLNGATLMLGCSSLGKPDYYVISKAAIDAARSAKP